MKQQLKKTPHHRRLSLTLKQARSRVGKILDLLAGSDGRKKTHLCAPFLLRFATFFIPPPPPPQPLSALHCTSCHVMSCYVSHVCHVRTAARSIIVLSAIDDRGWMTNSSPTCTSRYPERRKVERSTFETIFSPIFCHAPQATTELASITAVHRRRHSGATLT